MITKPLSQFEKTFNLPVGLTLVKTRTPKSMWAAAQGTTLHACADGQTIYSTPARFVKTAASRREFVRKASDIFFGRA